VTTWIVAEEPSGPGLRVAIKDLIDLAGLPTTAACRAVAATARPAETDAACLAGLRAACERREATVVGKTNLHELAYGVTGINPAFGTPVNPLDPERVPGGSSSGSAVAVAANEADVAIGTDTGGSIRIPAACCGVVGLKTTWGRLPLRGVRPLAPSLDTVGPLARDVAGVTAGMVLLEPGFCVEVGPPALVGRLRVAADPVVDAAVDDALGRVGWTLRPVELAGVGTALEDAMTILDAEAWAGAGALTAGGAPGLGADVAARLRRAALVGPARLARAHQGRQRWIATLDRLWARVQLLALPTLAGFPPLLDDGAAMARVRGVTAVVNLAGLPALALPVPSSGPLPASLSLVGPAGSEALLLAAGAALEAAVAA